MALTILLLTGSHTTAAQEPGPTNQTKEIWQVRGLHTLTPEVKESIAMSGEPIWVDVDRPMTLSDVYEQTCGDQGEASASLQREASRLNATADLHQELELGTTVAIPFCLRVDKNVDVIVRSNDTISELLNTYYVNDPELQMSTYTLNRGNSTESFERFSRTLQPGKAITLPYASQNRLFVARDQAPSGFQAIIEELEAQTQSNMEAVTESTSQRPEDPTRFEYVRFVSTDNAGPECSVDIAQRPSLIDETLLRQRLTAETSVAQARGVQIETPLIGVIDTGINLRDDAGFFVPFLRPDVREQNGTQDVEDNDNRFLDDVYGISFPASGDIQFIPTDLDREHGNKMASLAVGGLSLAQIQLAGAPWVNLKIVNFSSRSPGGTTVSAYFLGDAIDYLETNGAQVVNMSLSNRSNLVLVRNAIRNARALFVVAAGNHQSDASSDLGLVPVFPARYGGIRGDFARQLVTVGAHDIDGAWADFSYYSDEYVDLLAPGCSIPTRSIDTTTVGENGTSPATAVVSFGAALIRRLGGDHYHRQRMKNRLLVGTDVDPSLEDVAWTSGRFNIVKSISLYHDVVELADGTPYRFGHLLNREALPRFCGSPQVATQLGNIAKVVPNLQGAQGTEIEYWTVLDFKLHKTRCNQVRSSESIGSFDAGGTIVTGPALSEIADIVLGEPKRE